MAKPNMEWKVLPHGALNRIGSNLITVTGQLHMPLGDYPRRMTVVRLDDGRLVLYSAIALDEPRWRSSRPGAGPRCWSSRATSTDSTRAHGRPATPP
jgi:hypothetical protein